MINKFFVVSGVFLFILFFSTQTVHASSGFTITINSAKIDQLSTGTYRGTINYCFSSASIPQGTIHLRFSQYNGPVFYTDNKASPYPTVCDSSNPHIGNTYTWTMPARLTPVSAAQSNYEVNLKYIDTSTNGAQLYTVTFPTGVTGSTQILENTSSIGKNFSFGAKGSDVIVLQQYLIKAGILKTDATGFFGSTTAAAVKEFQRQNNLQVTGTVGSRTRGLINSLIQSTRTVSMNINTTPPVNVYPAGCASLNGFNSINGQSCSFPTMAQPITSSTSSSSTLTQPSSSDMTAVQAAIADIQQGYISGNDSLIVKHMSAETAQFFNSANRKNAKINSFVAGNISQVGSNIIVQITSSDSTLNGPIVFIKENGDWKFDFSATLIYAQQLNDAKKNIGDPNGTVDLVVTGVYVSPAHPIVNNKDVGISVSIKNIGTKTASEVSFEPKILEFTADWAPHKIQDLIALTPGETVVETWSPYENNEFFKRSDSAGQKTIQIVLNKDRKIVESNYDNNIFTQTVQMYAQ